MHDYQAFASEIPLTNKDWQSPGWAGRRFPVGPDYPVVYASWMDGKAFCAWLTDKERKAGLLTVTLRYRLPTDREWSCAVGIGDRESGSSPAEKDGALKEVYPWGTRWPPPDGAGNYADASAELLGDHRNKEYTDGYPTTAPVGSFPPNASGIQDLGGNVWEWCEDSYGNTVASKVIRGGAWFTGDKANLLASKRGSLDPNRRNSVVGFRVVLDTDAPKSSFEQQ